MDYNLIISPIAGATIGCVANWLAIQMLFFPIKEKRIFGFRIPFTPGIIPKERDRIARGVGDTVSNNFLSHDVILNAIISNDMESGLRKYIHSFIEYKKKSDQTLKEAVDSITDNKSEELIKYLTDKASDFLLSYSKSEEFVDFIVNIVYSKIINIDSDIKLNKVVPKGLLDYLKVKIFENSNKLSQIIIDYATSSAVQFKLRKALRDNFESSFKLKMLSKMVDVERIFEDILSKFIDYMEQQSTHKEISLFVIKMLDNFMEANLNDVIEKEFFEDEARIKAYLRSAIIGIIDANDNQDIKFVISNKINDLFNTKINILLDFVNQYDIKIIQDIIIINMKKIIYKESDKIFSIVNISKIIEDKINSFDTKEMVYIMYNSIKKDVLVMRLFESLIGFIIGLLIAVFPYIQKWIISLIY